MKKISYRPVYNRKNKLNEHGAALLQVEAYLERKKIYFSTHIYLSPEQWDGRKRLIVNHPNAEALNTMLHSFIIGLERKEIELWRSGQEITLGKLKEAFYIKCEKSFIGFSKVEVEKSRLKNSTKKNRFSTLHLLKESDSSRRISNSSDFCSSSYRRSSYSPRFSWSSSSSADSCSRTSSSSVFSVSRFI